MAKRYLTITPEDTLCVTQIIGNDDNGHKLNKTLFELSRTTDLNTHYNPTVHTRDLISAGLPGHRPLHIVGECDSNDIPKDQTFRHAWEWMP